MHCTYVRACCVDVCITTISPTTIPFTLPVLDYTQSNSHSGTPGSRPSPTNGVDGNLREVGAAEGTHTSVSLKQGSGNIRRPLQVKTD